MKKMEECFVEENEEISQMEAGIVESQTISAQSQNEFLGDLELSGIIGIHSINILFKFSGIFRMFHGKFKILWNISIK